MTLLLSMVNHSPVNSFIRRERKDLGEQRSGEESFMTLIYDHKNIFLNNNQFFHNILHE